jgi:hypothetical protein
MRRNHSMIVWGTLLLVAGIFIILGQTNIIQNYQQLILPAILLGISLAFHLAYFMSPSRNEGVLVPAGILLLYGLLFLANELVPQATMERLWPVFILGPALGLFEMYVFSKGRSGSLIPVFILTVIGGCALLLTCGVFTNFSLVVALLLIGIGAACMINAFIHDGRWHSDDKKAEPKTEETPKQ